MKSFIKFLKKRFGNKTRIFALSTEKNISSLRWKNVEISMFFYANTHATKGGLKLESTGGSSNCPKNTPKTILEL